jgi:hypothetical protein
METQRQLLSIKQTWSGTTKKTEPITDPDPIASDVRVTLTPSELKTVEAFPNLEHLVVLSPYIKAIAIG